MTIDQVRTATQAKPFRPFTLHLADGGQVPVQSPDFLLSVPSGRALVVCQPDDTLNIIDLLLVTDLEMKPSAPRPGKGRRDGR